MKFNLIDKIEFLSDERIVAMKNVSLAEEYLADHFPTFPVLPGVLMLEAAVQAGTWLLHQRQSFAHAIVVLKEARNVKYGHFVAPGMALRVEVDWIKATPGGALLKASGTVVKPDASTAAAFAARIELSSFNLAQTQPQLAEIDQRLHAHTRTRWAVLQPGPTAPPPTHPPASPSSAPPVLSHASGAPGQPSVVQ